jgi:hypothetical protein
MIGLTAPIKLNWPPKSREDEEDSDSDMVQTHELNMEELKHDLVKWNPLKVPEFGLDMCIEEDNDESTL